MIRAIVDGVRGATLRLQSAPVVGSVHIRGRHGDLLDRDEEKQHPISAIDGLQEALDEAAAPQEIPMKLPNPHPLHIGGKMYDGSEAVSVELGNGEGAAGNAAAVLLWAGSWSTAKGSTLTVSKTDGSPGCTGAGNISEYSILYMFCDSLFVYTMRNNGQVITGGCVGFSEAEYKENNSLGLVARTLRATVTGNKLTVAHHRSNTAADSTDGTSTIPIIAIYGII